MSCPQTGSHMGARTIHGSATVRASELGKIPFLDPRSVKGFVLTTLTFWNRGKCACHTKLRNSDISRRKRHGLPARHRDSGLRASLGWL